LKTDIAAEVVQIVKYMPYIQTVTLSVFDATELYGEIRAGTVSRVRCSSKPLYCPATAMTLQKSFLQTRCSEILNKITFYAKVVVMDVVRNPSHMVYATPKTYLMIDL